MKYLSKLISVVLIFILLSPLTGCVSMVMGGAASIGVAAMEDRPLRVHAKDTAIATEIRYNLVEAREKLITNIGVEVYEGKDVFNELQVGNNRIKDLAKDSWVTTQLRSKITFDQEILAINYFIETVNGTVYLIGIAQSQQEIEKVTSYARSLGYVTRVISHVRVKKVNY